MRSMCSSTPPAKAAQTQISDARAYAFNHRGTAAVAVPGEPNQRERRKTAVAMLSAAVHGQARTGQHERIALTARLGIHDPAGELRQARLGVRSGTAAKSNSRSSVPAARYSFTSSGASRA